MNIKRFHRIVSIAILASLCASLAFPAALLTATPSPVDQSPGVSPAPARASQVSGPMLFLRAAEFDPLAGEPAIPANLKRALAASQPGLRLIQFSGPIQDDWYMAMEKAGLQVVTYMPDYAYLVWGDDGSVAHLQATSPVRWAGIYQPWYALHPDLAEIQKLPKEVEVTVQVYAHPGADDTLRAIQSQAQVLTPDHPVLVYRNMSVRIAADQLAWLASLPDVVNVEPRPHYQLLDEVQGQIMAGNLNASGTQPGGVGYLAWLTSTIGFTTTASAYPIVDVTDDGIDDGTATPRHPDFWTFGITSTVDRLVYNYNWTMDPSADGLDGHGNLNASIVVGYNDKTGFPYEDGSGFNYGLGINPFGRVAGSKVFANGGIWSAPATNTPIISNTYALGARISSNSWGADTGGAYNTDCQEYDALVRDAQPGAPYAGNQEMITIFAAGNAGSGSNTVGSPGGAKNVISVGAAENYRPTWLDGCKVGPTGADNAQDIISFSSRGPMDDQRVKPDIVAPGTHIQGAASQDPGYNGIGVCDPYTPTGQTLYAASSGTSHSTPAIAGAASLLYRYYQDNFGGQPPSPAMTKAYMVNATRYLTGTGANDTLPSNSQGYGEINLGVAFDGVKRLTVDQSRIFSSTGEVYQLQGVVVNTSKPFRVTLAWTDAPGLPTGNAYVNNLDLAATVGGQTFLGNRFSGATSITGGSADPRNNVESVFLPAGTSGAFTVVITATNIAGDGVPGNADPTDQDFALVVYNAAHEMGALQGAVTTAGTGTPIVGATVQANSPAGSGTATSIAGGLYSMSLLPSTYTVTAAAYGFQPSTVSNIVVSQDLTTTQNLTLTPVANYYVVSGTVTDAAAGWPVSATITIAGYPTGTVSTNPATGFYSVSLPEGMSFGFTVNATGYLAASRAVGPLTANRTENFALNADLAICAAPGYHWTGWSENFDSVAAPLLPAGWTTTVVTSTFTLADWKTSTGTVQPSGVAPHSTPNLVYLNSYDAESGGANRLYRTTGLNMTAMPTTTLSLWMYHDTGWAASADRVQVQVSSNGGANWVDVGAPINRYDGSTGWKQHSVDLSAYASQVDLRIGLLGISAWGNDVHIDDIDVGLQCVQQTEGWLTGTVSDAVTSLPVANATVQATSPYAQRIVASGGNGGYNMFIISGTYTVTASAYGYMTVTIPGVPVVKALTTTQDISLPLATYHVVSGTIKDAATGWPLYARINIAGGVGSDIWTDPVTGFYSVSLPEGVSFTFNVSAWVKGYLVSSRAVGPLTANRTENFGLAADLASCTAPGYGYNGLAENFDSVAAPLLPAGWTTTVVTSTFTLADWKTSTGTVHPSGVAPHSTPNLVYLNSYDAESGGTNRLYRTTGLNMTAMPTTTLSLWMYHDTGYTSADRVQVQVSTTGGVSWVDVGAPINRYDGSTGWKQHSVDLSAYASQTDLRIGLLGISAWGNDVHVDDLQMGYCQLQAGGLVVGNAYALGSGTPLAGVTVQGVSGSTVTTVTVDPAVPDSFYTLFAPAGTQPFTATKANYGTVVTTTNVVQSNTVRLDFYLPSPYLALVAPSSAAQTANPNSTVTYTLIVTNAGTLTDSFTVTVSAGSLFANAVTPQVINNLAAGTSAPVTVTTSVPAGAAGGYSEAATVTATSQGDPAQQSTATLTTTVNTVRGILISPATDARMGLQGETVTYTLMLTNTGNATDSFTLTVSAGITFTNNILPPFISNLAPNASARVTVTVSIPSSLPGASVSDIAIVTAQSANDPAKTAVATLTTTVGLPNKVYLPVVMR